MSAKKFLLPTAKIIQPILFALVEWSHTRTCLFIFYIVRPGPRHIRNCKEKEQNNRPDSSAQSINQSIDRTNQQSINQSIEIRSAKINDTERLEYTGRDCKIQPECFEMFDLPTGLRKRSDLAKDIFFSREGEWRLKGKEGDRPLLAVWPKMSSLKNEEKIPDSARE